MGASHGGKHTHGGGGGGGGWSRGGGGGGGSSRALDKHFPHGPGRAWAFNGDGHTCTHVDELLCVTKSTTTPLCLFFFTLDYPPSAGTQPNSLCSNGPRAYVRRGYAVAGFRLNVPRASGRRTPNHLPPGEFVWAECGGPDTR